ncbi:hypothetical protein RUM43_000476 [Polyplax serrata]|uniref:Uncharacterized protein n=1 Tax=Polyplax serrata TaxID=468196 RepID=A0AAN8SE13_POLSC
MEVLGFESLRDGENGCEPKMPPLGVVLPLPPVTALVAITRAFEQSPTQRLENAVSSSKTATSLQSCIVGIGNLALRLTHNGEG